MNRYADPDPYGISETELAGYDLAADPAYNAFLAAHAAPEDDHSTCQQYNPFGMCAICEGWYQQGMAQGASDFANGVTFDDGAASWRTLNPQIPNVTGGAIEGYGHGWMNASLRSMFRATSVPYYELRY